MAATSNRWTWSIISRAIGLTLVIVLLVAFLVSFATGLMLDRTVTLAFLGIASFLIGAPSGFQILVGRRNGEGS